MDDQNKVTRILLIDDDEDDRFFFKEALRKINKDTICDCATDGETGLKKLNSTILPDYIFLDLNMPKIDGMQVLKLIKETKSFSHIPVIIYSTSENHHHITQAKSLGATEYISKPTRIPDLVNILRPFVDNPPTV